MSDQTGSTPHHDEVDEPVGTPDPVAPAGSTAVGAPPSDLTTVAAAMAEVRAAMPRAGAPASVPDDAEVAALDHAHDTLRTALDRAERGG